MSGNLLDMGPLRKCLPLFAMGAVVPTHLPHKLWDQRGTIFWKCVVGIKNQLGERNYPIYDLCSQLPHRITKASMAISVFCEK